MTRFTLFGLGEAGSLFAADLVAAGVEVHGYDPAPVMTPAGVIRHGDPSSSVAGADVVLALAPQADALTAVTQAIDDIPPTALYADLSTSAATVKRALAAVAADRGLAFADVALLAVVPGNGMRAPALASGTGADRYVATMAPMGVPVTSIGGVAGEAATRKLLRSVMMKGLAALVIEAMRAADAADLSEWLWGNLVDEITNADEALLARLVRGTGTHSLRRLHEMEACEAQLAALGVDPVMTRSTVESLRRIPAEGVPNLPTG
jgi:3-hydroxyisobutyrate dehydrogenase-like beta-hydroxyacid dehydrogenase